MSRKKKAQNAFKGLHLKEGSKMKLSIENQLEIKGIVNPVAGGFIKDGSGRYSVGGTLTDDDIVLKAKLILAERNKKGTKISSPQSSRDYIQLKIAELECEVFGAIFLDTKHRVIGDRILFRGTINSASVPCREVVKEALACNAAAMIVYHNHPSGNCEPSSADKALTDALYLALGMVDIKLLDHFVCSTDGVVSFAELGKLG